MWELAYKESWAPKNWCFGTVVLEKTLKTPLDCKEIKPVHPKGNQPWVFIESTDAEAPILLPPHAKSWLIGKDPDAGEDWGQEEKGTTEDDMVGWHRWLNGRGFGWTLAVGYGQGGLACCSPGGRKELDTTERLNGNEQILPFFSCETSLDRSIHLDSPELGLFHLDSGNKEKIAVMVKLYHGPKGDFIKCTLPTRTSGQWVILCGWVLSSLAVERF